MALRLLFYWVSNASTQNSLVRGGVDMSYEYIQVEHREEVAVIRLDRPKAHNALCTALNLELESALTAAMGTAVRRCVRALAM